MAKSPFGSLADLIAQLGVQPEQPKPQEPGVETPKPQDPDKPKPEVPQSDLGKVFDKKATFTLTKEQMQFPAEGVKNDGDDVIEATVSPFLDEATLDYDSQIDGGKGNDTLKVDLKSDFYGLLSDGKIVNVETIALSNDEDSAYSFSAQNIKGVEQYALKGMVNLTDLASVPASISVMDRQDEVEIGFAEATIKGKSDAITLNVSGLGAESETEGGDATYATLKLQGVETMTLNALGANNYIENDAKDLKKLVVAGNGNLDLKIGTQAASTLADLDASALKGTLATDLSGLAKLKNLKLGAGDDEVAVKDSLVSVDGGEGEDTLVIHGDGTNPSRLKTKAVETLKFDAGVSGALTMYASELAGVQKFVAGEALNEDVTLKRLGDKAVSVSLEGANANAAKNLTLDHTGKTTINVEKPAKTATEMAPSANKFGVIASRSTGALELNVAEKMDYQGVVKAVRAAEVVVDIAGQTSGLAEIKADRANKVTIKKVANDSTLKLTAAKAEALTIDSEKGLALTGSTLDSVKTLTIRGGDGEIGATALGLKSLATATINGTMDTVVKFATLGSEGSKSALSLKADGVKEITTTGLNSGKAVTVNLTNIDDKVALGAINAGSKGKVSLAVQGYVDAGATVGTVDADSITANFNIEDKVEMGALTAKIVQVVATASTVKFDAITADKIVLGLTGVEGVMDFNGKMSVGESIIINGSKENPIHKATGSADAEIEATGKALNAILNAGTGDDKIKITAKDATTKKIVVKGDLGDGDGELTISTTNATAGIEIDVTSIKGAKTATITTAAASADTIKLGEAKETVVLTGNTAIDTITGFKAGAEGDALKIVGAGTYAGSASVIAAAADKTMLTGNVYVVDQKATDIGTTAITFGDYFATSGKYFSTTVAASAKATLVVVGQNHVQIYSVDAGGGTATTIEAGEVKLIGILEGDYKVADFAAGNFANA